MIPQKPRKERMKKLPLEHPNSRVQEQLQTVLVISVVMPETNFGELRSWSNRRA